MRYIGLLAGVGLLLAVTGTAEATTFDNPMYNYYTILDVGSNEDTTESQFSNDGTKILWSEREKNSGGTWVRKAVKYGDWDPATRTISNIQTVVEMSNSSGINGTVGYAKWSPDDSYIAYGLYDGDTSENAIKRYKVSDGTVDTLYSPGTGDDWGNFDFYGDNDSVVFWDYGTGGSVADLFTYDKSTDTRSALTSTANYKEYEPRVLGSDTSQVLYWSGESTTEPYRSIHILNSDGTITDVALGTADHNYFWPVWGKNQSHIGIVDHGSSLWTGDLLLYEKVAGVWQFADDLTGPGYESESIIFFGSFDSNGNFCYQYETSDGSRDIMYGEVIPEPVTMAGLVLGIGCLARYVRRRRM